MQLVSFVLTGTIFSESLHLKNLQHLIFSYRGQDVGPLGLWSKRQVELFLGQQAKLIQEGGALPAPELQAKIQDVLVGNPEHAEAVSLFCFFNLISPGSHWFTRSEFSYITIMKYFISILAFCKLC